MTTIVSRMYEDLETAERVLRSLREIGATDASIVTGGENTADRIEAWRVDPEAASIYAPHVDSGHPLVIAAAGFTPMGLAREVIATVDAAGPLAVGVKNENRYIRVRPKSAMLIKGSVLSDHPRFTVFPEGDRKRGRISDVFGLRSIITGRYARSVLKGAPHISTALLPIPLLDHQRKRVSAGPGGTLTSALFRTVSRSG